MRIRVAVIADIREQARLRAFKKDDLDLSCNAVLLSQKDHQIPSHNYLQCLQWCTQLTKTNLYCLL